MKLSGWRPIAAISIVFVTAAVFTLYFVNHPEVRHQLSHMSPGVLAGLLALYFLSICALALTTLATLRICRLKVDTVEGLLLTAYSAVVNFFGPLQSGPAFRAVYLKKKYRLDLKIFAMASLGYLFFWGAYSLVFLLSWLLKWWLVPLSVFGGLLALAVLRSQWVKPRVEKLDLRGWYFLAAATLLQIIFVTLVYFIELRTVAPGTSFSQAIIYTGAANLALYVSLTPGAIGFRESFLVFSQRLHHIDSGTIVAANIIDRAVYVVLLAILAFFIFATHAKRRLSVDVPGKPDGSAA